VTVYIETLQLRARGLFGQPVVLRMLCIYQDNVSMSVRSVFLESHQEWKVYAHLKTVSVGIRIYVFLNTIPQQCMVYVLLMSVALGI
jgi:hypothetical protein